MDIGSNSIMEMKMEKISIGVIGGSGLYDMEELKDVEERRVETPFGEPSDLFTIGTLSGRRVAFLPRHGRGHRIPPGKINFRANFYAFKALGVERIISATAVGSLKESIHPLDAVIPDQCIDLTKGRASSFFEDGIVAHMSMAEPFCPLMRRVLAEAAADAGLNVHPSGTYVCIEGPQFSTKAESELYRSWKVDVIGMTNLPEAKLAREAEICYGSVAFVTDYDCWHEEEEEVSVEMLIDNLRKNSEAARKIITRAVSNLPEERECPCPSALSASIITDGDVIGEETKKKLSVIISKYIGD